MYLVFDIGGTNTRIAVSEDGKNLGAIKTFPTQQDFESQIQQISQLTHELTNGQKIEAAAGGVAGVLDKEKNALLSSPHLESWSHKPLKEELETIFDAPVYLENDAHLGGLGEAVFGAGKGYSIVAFITIGTGVGGVRIVNGKIDAYSQGFEPGHQIIEANNTLEKYIAGSYLQEPVNWDEVARNLAIGLNNTIVHWSPDIVVLGGTVGLKIPLDQVKQNLAADLKIFTPPPVIYSSLSDNNGLYGSLALISSSITSP